MSSEVHPGLKIQRVHHSAAVPTLVTTSCSMACKTAFSFQHEWDWHCDYTFSHHTAQPPLSLVLQSISSSPCEITRNYLARKEKSHLNGNIFINNTSFGLPLCVCKYRHVKSKNTERELPLGTSQQMERVYHSAACLRSSVIRGLTRKLLFLEILIWVVPYHITGSKNSVCRVRGTKGSVLAAFSLEQGIKGRRQGFFWKGRYSQGTVRISNILWQILASNVIAFSSDYEVRQNALYKLQTYLKNKQFA